MCGVLQSRVAGDRGGRKSLQWLFDFSEAEIASPSILHMLFLGSASPEGQTTEAGLKLGCAGMSFSMQKHLLSMSQIGNI